MSGPELLMSGLTLGESPRWHDDKLWFCDWGAHEIVTVDHEGNRDVVPTAIELPWSIDWLPDGRLLVVSSTDHLLMRQEDDGSFVPHADLESNWNELVVDVRGNTYVNSIGFDLMGGEAAKPGHVAVVSADGTARRVADDVEFPNGMVVTADGSTLILAESYGRRLTAFDISDTGGLRNRRVWADLGEGTPDGICIDAEGAVWYADVPNRRCVRVREGGAVLQTVGVDRGCFACMLGGDDGLTLFIVAADWRGPGHMFDEPRSGQVLTFAAAVPHAGFP